MTAQCLEVDALGRKNKRRDSGRAKFQRAVGAILGNVLTGWRKDPPCAVFQSRHKEVFTGELVGFARYTDAEAALLSLGFLERSASVAYPRNDSLFGEFQRNAARIRPSGTLLALAATYGLSPDNVGEAFRTDHPPDPLSVKGADLVEVREALSAGKKSAGLRRRRLSAVEALPVFDAIREDVAAMNAEAMRHDYRGCRPPSWSRVFTEGVLFNGRWQARGQSYQIASKAEREAIIIDGAPVVELDIRASHLTILAALAGYPMPEGDPYAVAGVPRDVVKQWVVITLGNGGMPRQWSARTKENLPAVAEWPVCDVQAAALKRLPFLEQPTAPAVIAAARLDELDTDQPPARLLSLRLMAIEAEAMTLAMRQLRDVGTIALPVHDSLIVPASAAGSARKAMQEACRATYGVVPVITGGE